MDRSIYEPAPVIETNVKGTFTLLEVARALRIERFLQISTDEVYGDLPPGAFADESSPLRPSSPYSASKAGADLLVLSYVRTYGLPAVITRSSNNYGPYQFPEKFLPLMITNALDHKPLPIYGDGKQQRDWLHVEDNCRGILAVLEKGASGRGLQHRRPGYRGESRHRTAPARVDGAAGIAAQLRKGSPRPRSALCVALPEAARGAWLEATDFPETKGCARRSIGTRRTPLGWLECAEASTGRIMRNITRTAIRCDRAEFSTEEVN